MSVSRQRLLLRSSTDFPGSLLLRRALRMLEISLHDLLLLRSSLILEKLTGWKYLINSILHLLLLLRLVHVMIKSMVKGLVVSS